MEMCIQNLVKFCPLVLKILSGNEILTSIKGHYPVANLQKTKFLHMLVKLVLISDTYCIFIVCYTPIATFQKADTCLDAQQSMAKQPIKG